MSNSFETLTRIYKPYRLTKINKCTIMNTMEGNLIIKERTATDYSKLYRYLTSRSFNNFPKLISNNIENYNVFEYIEDINLSEEQKAQDLIKIIANLHNKTVYFKEITKDKYKEIYEEIKNNITYIQNYYNHQFDQTILNEYLKPSEYLFVRNFTLIDNACNYCITKLENWYNTVEKLDKQRVCLIHNNLKLEHYLKNENDYLISWDQYQFDTPIIDLYKFYTNEWEKINFSSILETYEKEFKLLPEERILLDILISLPYIIQSDDKELLNCRNYRHLINYLNKSSKVVLND